MSETCSQKNSDTDDCPPPIPPRPSFTFAARRNAPDDDTSSQQTDAVCQGRLNTDGDAVDSVKPPVPLPRHKSTQSTDELDVAIDVGRDDLFCCATANDDVFLTGHDTEAALADNEGTTEHLSGGVSTEQLTDSMRYEQPAECSDNGQTTASWSSAVPSGDCVDRVPVPGHATVAAETCGQDNEPTDSPTLYHVRTSADKPPLQLTAETRSPESRAAVFSFSEMDDFGLDPDLFRPDCLDCDVPFVEKTAKFTHSSPMLYDAVTDDDEFGKLTRLTVSV